MTKTSNLSRVNRRMRRAAQFKTRSPLRYAVDTTTREGVTTRMTVYTKRQARELSRLERRVNGSTCVTAKYVRPVMEAL